jgi:hypothetical protein
LPLYGLLRRITDPHLDDRYRDVLRIACLPFLHPRMRSDLTAKPFYLMSPEELEQVEQAQLEHEKQVARGRSHIRLLRKGDRMKSARDRWFDQLQTEQDRRRYAELLIDGRDPREAFIATLGVIGERLVTAPGYVEPSEAEKKQWGQELDVLFRELFPQRYKR